MSFFFFFNDTATTEIYTLSLHDALPISPAAEQRVYCAPARRGPRTWGRSYRECDPTQYGRWASSLVRDTAPFARHKKPRSEEHTSELQSQSNLVCRLLLEKKKTQLRSYAVANCAFRPKLPNGPTAVRLVLADALFP